MYLPYYVVFHYLFFDIYTIIPNVYSSEYYILKWLIKIVDCIIFALKSRHNTSFLLPFFAYFSDL